MEFIDDLQRSLWLPAQPQRIVCLVPSITETLFALGAGERIVGITEYCTHPPEGVARVAKIGGTKTPHLDGILHLAPDLVIANDEENRRDDFLWLVEHGLQVYVTAPRTVADGITMIDKLGALTGCQSQSKPMVCSLRAAYERVVTEALKQPRLRVFCPIWRKPWMAFNADTYADDMLWCCGGENVVRAKAERYLTVSLEEIAALSPQVVLLPSEPYPFATKHFVQQGGHFYCIDGMALCWYGPRIADGLEHLSGLFAYVRGTLD
jgi:ABC-type Fe3+-hydroxamate transport system substrate-binding protein